MDLVEIHCTSQSDGRLGTEGSSSFSKALVAKCAWNIINGDGLWNRIIYQKYITPLSVIEWIRAPDKTNLHASIFWKAIAKSFDIVGGWIA